MVSRHFSLVLKKIESGYLFDNIVFGHLSFQHDLQYPFHPIVSRHLSPLAQFFSIKIQCLIKLCKSTRERKEEAKYEEYIHEKMNNYVLKPFFLVEHYCNP